MTIGQLISLKFPTLSFDCEFQTVLTRIQKLNALMKISERHKTEEPNEERITVTADLKQELTLDQVSEILSSIKQDEI